MNSWPSLLSAAVTSSLKPCLSRSAVAGVALATAAGLAACGSDDSDSDAAASSPASGAPAEVSATAQAEEDPRQRELQTYSGWDSLGDAKQQLDAWDISCSDDPAAEGKVAWSNLDGTSLLAFKFSADGFEKEGVFDDVSREEMVSVSGGDWQFICAPGGERQCQTVSEKTGKPVMDGVQARSCTGGCAGSGAATGTRVVATLQHARYWCLQAE